MRLAFLAFFVFAATAITAQTGVIQQVAQHASERDLRKNLYALASDRMAGRLMGSHGNTLAAQYVAAAFRKAGVEGPYENGQSYFQAIRATRFDDRSSLDFAGKNYADPDGWKLFPNDTFQVRNLPIVVNNLVSIEDWNKHLDELPLAGSAVLVDEALFDNLDRLDSLEKVFVSKGVRLVIWTNPRMAVQLQQGKEHSFLPVYKVSAVFAEPGLIHELALSPELLDRTFAVLNLDMLGRIDTLYLKAAKQDSDYIYILVKDDTVKHALRKALFEANQPIGLTLDTYYEQPRYMQRRLLGSDQYAFYEKGIPFVRIDCGFAKEYHKPEDTPDKIDYPLLTKQAQLAFLTIWNMANL